MKRVIVISSINICSGNNAASARIMNIAKSLSLAGTQVLLCSAASNHNINLDNKKQLFNNVYMVGEENNVGIKNKILLKIYDIYNSFSFIIRINKLSKDESDRVVIYLYPSPKVLIDLLSVIYLKHIWRKKIYYEANEVRLYGLYNRSFSTNPVKKIYEKYIYFIDYIKYSITEKLTSYYDGIVVISTNIEEYFSTFNQNLLRVPILSDVPSSGLKHNNRRRYTPGGEFSICFTGMIMLKKEGFDLLYKALSLIKEEKSNFQLHLYGPISSKERPILLEIMPRKYGIKENIHYHGIVDQSYLPEEMQKHHLLILPRPLTPQTRTGFSTKLSEYMVSGVPVLATDVSDNAVYIKDGINGFIVPPGKPEIMAKKILEIMDNYESNTDEIVENAFETAKCYFDYAKYSKQIDGFMS